MRMGKNVLSQFNFIDNLNRGKLNYVYTTQNKDTVNLFI